MSGIGMSAGARILERVRKMLRLANDAGASEGEYGATVSLAQQLGEG